jgi:hypothetical protein
MINGQIALQGFAYQVGDGEGQRATRGQILDEKVPLKILAFKDANSGLLINLVFSPEEFEEFKRKIDGGNIVPAKVIPGPGSNLSPFTRNGGIKG